MRQECGKKNGRCSLSSRSRARVGYATVRGAHHSLNRVDAILLEHVYI